MIKRKLEKQLLQLIKHFPAVCVLGPRQVGKTTLVKRLALIVKKPILYLDLERPTDRLKLQDAESYLAQHHDKCIIVDEVQFMPELFQLLRPLIDEKRMAGRFILTGSASPELIKGASESLAGRIAYVELSPFSLLETGTKPMLERHWFRGGFPSAYSPRQAVSAKQWLDFFIKSYLERDLNLIYNINFTRSVMQKMWTMIAHFHGNILQVENFSRSLGVTGPTASRYFDFLEGAFIIHRLPAYSHNSKKRLIKSPKLYLRDSGVLHRLLHFDDIEDLKSNVIIGNSWEGYVIEQIYNSKPDQLRMYYYRTHDGAETDVVLEKGNKVVACVEIKFSNAPILSKGFYIGLQDLKCKNGFVITPSSENYLNGQGVRICSLTTFLKMFLPNL
ncbi:MAG: ATP-binding protein [Cytophagales bacterium]|nr:ATP-binding protein [Cytophagales bacterium]MCA6367823.1 ATP-binding protein [Cytophagales bacterium]MCA6369894.1 ATP-binding protein [Cytophagales bacterium]MCA6375052.1 ATP-binding protein [Cytophagales bacterium]MCA6382637.1 ATP-binding protein [Cytophagales bacterium]